MGFNDKRIETYILTGNGLDFHQPARFLPNVLPDRNMSSDWQNMLFYVLFFFNDKSDKKSTSLVVRLLPPFYCVFVCV